MPEARLFVAAWPDERTAARLAALPIVPADAYRPVRPENWHVTLRFLGEVDIDDARAALTGARLPATVAALGPAVTELDGHLVVPVAGVDALAAAVVHATGHLGQGTTRPFRGHLTIARRSGRRSGPERRHRTIGSPITSDFEVGEIALVRSDLTSDGARYETLATYATSSDR